MIGLIAAMDKELKSILSHLQEPHQTILGGKIFYQGRIANREVVVALSGIGKINAAMTATLLFSHFVIHECLNFGVAGGIEPFQVSDHFIASQVTSFDQDLRLIDPHMPFGQMADEPLCFPCNQQMRLKLVQVCQTLSIPTMEGTLASGDQFVGKLETLQPIRQVIYDVLACDMEALAVAMVASKFFIPFAVIRSISDIVGKNHQDETYHQNVGFVADRNVDIVLKYLNQ